MTLTLTRSISEIKKKNKKKLTVFPPNCVSSRNHVHTIFSPETPFLQQRLLPLSLTRRSILDFTFFFNFANATVTTSPHSEQIQTDRNDSTAQQHTQWMTIKNSFEGEIKRVCISSAFIALVLGIEFSLWFLLHFRCAGRSSVVEENYYGNCYISLSIKVFEKENLRYFRYFICEVVVFFNNF